MTQPSHSIAIVGGGFSGTALATMLLKAGHPGLTVHVVEPRPRLGWGLAYGEADANHILNVPAERMSPWVDKPHDFLNWARRCGPRLGWPEAASAHEGTYLPRRLFGHYIQTALEVATAQARAAGGPVLIHHGATVKAVSPQDGGGFRLELGKSAHIFAHVVVLATGFRPPALPFPVEGNGHRLIDPWALGVHAIGRDDSVLIAGTGLSMVDMVYSLERAGHRGEVVAVSRHGLLPRIRGHSEDVSPLLTETDARRGALQSLRKFRRAIRTGQADWRCAMDGLRPVIDILWRALPPEEQDRFLRHLKPFWEVHRHRMPAESADLLLRRMARGTLVIESARVQNLILSANGIEAALKLRGTSVTRHRRFHWVINCTTPSSPLHAPDDLFRTLLAAGLVRADRTGMGLDVEPDGTLRDADGAAIQGLFALGPLRRGYAIETTAVPHIRPQLEALAATLLSRVEGVPRRSIATR